MFVTLAGALVLAYAVIRIIIFGVEGKRCPPFWFHHWHRADIKIENWPTTPFCRHKQPHSVLIYVDNCCRCEATRRRRVM